MRDGASGARRPRLDRLAVRLSRTRCHGIFVYGSPGQHQSPQTRRPQRVVYLQKIQDSTQEDMPRVLERRRYLRGAAWDSTPIQGAKRYRDIGPAVLTTSRLDLQSTHHPVAGAKHAGRCFRAIPWRAIEWRRRSDFSPLFPAALPGVAPIAAAQALDSVLSWDDGVGRRSAQGSRTSTEDGIVFARYESWVLYSCWPRTINHRLRLLLQQASEFAQLFERIADCRERAAKIVRSESRIAGCFASEFGCSGKIGSPEGGLRFLRELR